MNFKEQLLLALAALFTPKMQNSKQRLARMRLAGIILVCSLLANVYFISRLVKVTLARNDLFSKLQVCSKHDGEVSISNTTLNHKLYACEAALGIKGSTPESAASQPIIKKRR